MTINQQMISNQAYSFGSSQKKPWFLRWLKFSHCHINAQYVSKWKIKSMFRCGCVSFIFLCFLVSFVNSFFRAFICESILKTCKCTCYNACIHPLIHTQHTHTHTHTKDSLPENLIILAEHRDTLHKSNLLKCTGFPINWGYKFQVSDTLYPLQRNSLHGLYIYSLYVPSSHK